MQRRIGIKERLVVGATDNAPGGREDVGVAVFVHRFGAERCKVHILTIPNGAWDEPPLPFWPCGALEHAITDESMSGSVPRARPASPSPCSVSCSGGWPVCPRSHTVSQTRHLD